MSSLSYTVFLSFRGEDTRKNIVSHLHQKLISKGISTFKDDREIKLGETISEKLIGVINNSKFAVVVISENYATSTWCLDELQLIMDLEKQKKIEVIPLFYGMFPSDVRHNRGNFDLERYQNHKMADKIPKWKEALQLIAGRNGAVSLSCTDEAKMIKDIVERISSRLLSLMPIDLEGKIVGLEVYMEGLRPLLDMESMDKKVRMIGICGIKGIGKTTIASYLYEKHKNHFSTHHCFIENIRSLVELPNGLLELQKKLVSDVISEHNVNLTNREQGARLIKGRLENLKVLLVLDDVDNGFQLHYLARDVTWFGPGSRIIITTRNKNFLRLYRETFFYDVKCLDHTEALKLFKDFAFQGQHPSPPPPHHLHLYNHLLNRIAWHAHGLPSTLIAFGLSLRGKSLEEWQNALKSLDKAFQDNIKRMLINSYESLNGYGKIVCLHVACLFNGDNVRRVVPLFLNKGVTGIRDLVEMSLIELSADGIILMPALVEKMGKQIVRQESDNNPANQRILWHQDDIIPVVARKSGAWKTGGIAVDVGKMPNGIHIDWNVFKGMHNLIFLKIYNNSEPCKAGVIFEEDSYVPRKLRLLDWDAYPFTALPSMINPVSLVELNLCNSKLTTLWSGTPELLHLRKLDLSGSKYLKQLPDLTKAMSLEELILEGCSSLRGIPMSIYSLPRLQKLDLFDCSDLRNLTIFIRESETIVLQGGSLGIRSLKLALVGVEPPPEISLKNLSINGKLNIKFLQVLEGYAEHLRFVYEQHVLLEHQTSDLILPNPWKSLDIIRYCTRERGHFKCNSFSGFPWVMELNLINLNIQDIPDDIHQMVVLEKLDLSGNSFKALPSTMNYLLKLKHLTLCNCRELKELPKLYQLEKLILSDCTKLTTLVNPLDQRRYRLHELWIDNCKNVENLSDQLARFQKLRYLDMSRHDFETVPLSINNLSSLVTLCLNYCNNLTSLGNIPRSLKCLKAHGCNSLLTPIYTCLHPTHNIRHITRFPAGRRGDELPMCGCFKETMVPRTNDQLIWSPTSVPWQLLTPWLRGFAIRIIVMRHKLALFWATILYWMKLR